GPAVTREDELHRPAAEATRTVVEHEVVEFHLPSFRMHGIMVNMLTKNSKAPKKRGRPPGRTAEGEATRRRLLETAVDLSGERGYGAATLRDVAQRADVSPTLLYRYFPSKRAVVLALYHDLSVAFAVKAAALPAGRWRDRFLRSLEWSLEVLGPHRVT